MNTRDELLRELDNTDRRTLELIEDLDDAQLAVPYDRGINPPIWELGHAAFFTELFLLRGLGDPEARMPGYDDIWDSFRIPHRRRWQPGVVPGKQATVDYYRRVTDETRGCLESGDVGARECYLAKYAIFHQNMHIESLVWCRQTLGYPPPPSAKEDPPGGAAVAAGDARVDGGSYPIGMPAGTDDFATTGFAFDNEKPGYHADLEPFSISKRLVSNREFLEFIEAGGYETPSAWSYGGRCWLEEQQPSHPLYWRRDDHGAWQVRRFDRWQELSPRSPAIHINFWEAEAYCNRAGRRLPTEFEWEAAARGPDGRNFPWGEKMDAARVDMDAGHLGHLGVDALPAGASPAGCLQLLGTAWEWTSSQYLPYDGFAVDMYPFMSTLQFGSNKTTKGGSCATSSCLIRGSYRQAYLPERRDGFTGFRTCAR